MNYVDIEFCDSGVKAINDNKVVDRLIDDIADICNSSEVVCNYSVDKFESVETDVHLKVMTIYFSIFPEVEDVSVSAKNASASELSDR